MAFAVPAAPSITLAVSLSTSQNNWAPAGNTTANIWVVNCTAQVDITGITAPVGSRVIVLHNDGTNGFTLVNLSGSSSAANRIDLGGVNRYVPAGTAITLFYNPTTSYWNTLSTTNLSPARLAMLFGNGQDGAGSNISASLSKDTYYSNLTQSTGSALTTAGYLVFVAGTLDISSAPAAAIRWNGNNGGNGAAATTGGSAGGAVTSTKLGGCSAAQTGGAGGATTGSQPTTATVPTRVLYGGQAGGGGGGGTGASGAGGTGRTAVVTGSSFNYVFRLSSELNFATSISLNGSPAQSGSGGGGDGTAGSGGGGGGTSGGIVAIFARTINRGAGTAVGAIQAKGGNGGAGGTPAAGNRGGGGGGGGGHGGTVYIVYLDAIGSSASDIIDVTGGNGGAGGNGLGTGTGGGRGGAGGGGKVVLINALTGAISFTAATAGNTGTGSPGVITGDTTQTATTVRVSF